MVFILCWAGGIPAPVLLPHHSAIPPQHYHLQRKKIQLLEEKPGWMSLKRVAVAAEEEEVGVSREAIGAK